MGKKDMLPSIYRLGRGGGHGVGGEVDAEVSGSNEGAEVLGLSSAKPMDGSSGEGGGEGSGASRRC